MPDLTVDIAGPLATLTLNRPEARNALSMEMRGLLNDALHQVEFDPTVRCVLIQGAGEHFMAGGDIKNFEETLSQTRGKDYWMRRIHDIHTVLYSLRRMPKPVVASVSGAAAGAGVSLAAACDLVIASADAFFTLAYCHLGVSPDWGSSYHLPRALGIKRAMQMALLGERIDAQTMHDWGLVNFLVPQADLEAETQKLVKRLACGPTRAYGNTKALLYRSLESELESQAQAEAEAFADSASSHDFKVGVRSFIEKRKPEFSGR